MQSIQKIVLREYQKDAVRSVVKAVSQNSQRIPLVLGTGTGKSIIIAFIIRQILDKSPDHSILVLSQTRAEMYQLSDTINSVNEIYVARTKLSDYKSASIICTTYNDLLTHEGLFGDNNTLPDVIICNSMLHSWACYQSLFDSSNHSIIIAMFSSKEDLKQNAAFRGIAPVFVYSSQNAIVDGYLNPRSEHELVEVFCKKLFSELGYNNMQNNPQYYTEKNSTIRPDIVINDTHQNVIIEVKAYSSINVPSSVINTAIEQSLYYKTALTYGAMRNTKTIACLILLCSVSEEVKKYHWDQNEIAICDISNLLYLCQGKNELLDDLEKRVSFSIEGLSPIPPIGWPEITSPSVETPRPPYELDYMNGLLARLQQCCPGKQYATEYERICTEAIRYLFSSEFSVISEQHRTGDEMFRMDLLCALKGQAEVWKMLITHFNTRFVVFEYKNYSESITQNYIYITEKYLFSTALRNVAFIISRYGFDDNAKKAAIGVLREHGKLIISLTDDDLVDMLRMKADGQEPSDHLLDSVQRHLMAISK